MALDGFIEQMMKDYPDFIYGLLSSDRSKVADMQFAARLALARLNRLYYDSDLTQDRRDKLDAIWEILDYIGKA